MSRRRLVPRAAVPQRFGPGNANSAANRAAVAAMTEAERRCGHTAEKLAAEQARLKAEALARLARRAA